MAIQEIFKGDNADFVCKVNTDITTFKIRAEMYDNFSQYLRKATSNVNGGDTGQIEITNSVEGRFTIHILKTETADFHRETFLQITLTTPDEKDHTLPAYTFALQEKRITWDSIANATAIVLPLSIDFTIPEVTVVEGLGTTITPDPLGVTFTIPAPTIITT